MLFIMCNPLRVVGAALDLKNYKRVSITSQKEQSGYRPQSIRCHESESAFSAQGLFQLDSRCIFFVLAGEHRFVPD